LRAQRFLILDACVLIDFCKVDRTILSVVSAHVGKIHVPSPVLAEVDQLEEAEAMALGIEIVEPEIDQLVAAGATRAGLSFEDRLCVMMAKDRAWSCVSNDGAVRKACAVEAVPVLWGLEMMGLAVEVKALGPAEAENAAWAIHRENPRYVTKEIVERFIRKARRGWR
jgi:hypothetical protein